MKRSRLLAGLLLAAAVAMVAVVVAVGSSSPTSSDVSSTAPGAASVQRRDLVETDTESGTLAYANPQTIYNRLSGTITWLPAVGQLIKPGQALYAVNGHPAVLFDGALPAYRALKAGDSDGQDILQLNRDLARMGFADGQITIDDAWQTGTTDAVERWQASLGEKQTGKIALGRIVFLPGAQRVTQLDTTCGSTGGGSSSGSSSGSGSGPTNGCGVSDASATTPASHAEFVQFTTSSTTTPTTTTTTPTTTTPTTTTPTTTTPNKTKPPSGHKPSGPGNRGGKGSGSGGGKGSGKGSGKSGSKGSGNGKSGSKGGGNGKSGSKASGNGKSGSKGSGNASGSGKGSGSAGSSGGGSGSGSGTSSSGAGTGSSAGSATAILQTTSITLVVTVDLDPSKQSEAKVGEPVTVEMPAGNTVNGKITAVSPIAQSSSSSSSSSSGSGSGSESGSGGGSSGSTIPVTITLSGHQSGAGLDQASVSVNFQQQKANNVLSVPVTALLATPGGGYAVQEAAAPHTLVPVTTGLFAAGFVQISGSGIYPGQQVTDSQG